ncbi:MAG: DUF2341 domain-containing protein [Candidatus Woesebacteria bacterium]|nr:MAG: DUF2341 domain-containing protein [Candidatus Woesebacteria bacterium]
MAKKKLPSTIYHLLSTIKLRTWIALTFLTILLPVGLLSLRTKNTTEAAWFDDSWAFRKAITVSESGATETNKYLTISNYDASDTTKYQSDCGDVRFTDAGGTLLVYTVSTCGATTTFHVNMQTIFTGTNATTIYLYYGNPSAVNGFVSTDPYTACAGCSVGTTASEEKGLGPVAYYKFDEGFGTTAYDSSKNANNGTLTVNPSIQNNDMCITGKCLKFTNHSYVTAPDSASTSITGSLTLSAWIKPLSNTASTRYPIAGKVDNSALSYLLEQFGTEIRMYIGSESNYVTTNSVSLQTNKWYQVEAVYNASGQTVTIYVNGIAQASTTTGTIPASISDSGNAFNIGEANAVGAATTIPTITVADHLQDWEIDNAFFDIDGEGSNQDFTGFDGGGNNWAGWRFALSQAIPSNAFITSATVTVNSQGTWQWDATDYMRLFVTDSSDAAAATVATDRPSISITAGGTTTVYPTSLSGGVRWPASGGLTWPVSGTNTTSTNMSINIQYLVNNYSGLANGAHIVAWMAEPEANGANSSSEVAWLDRNAGATNAAKLDVSYVTGYFYSGFIDEVKVYNYARSSSQAQTDYTRGSSSKGLSAVLGTQDTSFLNNGLIGYWKMDETSGNASDSSGNAVTLTNNGSTAFSAGKFGNAPTFNGSSKYFNSGSTISGVQTISFWVNPGSTTDNFINLAAGIYINATTGTVAATGFTSPTIYVNGVQSSTIVASSWQLITVVDTTGTSASAFEIGRANSSYAANNSQIDEIRLYNRALSAAEVQQLYSFSAPPILYYDFENSSTTTAYDKSLNVNNGTLSNFTMDNWVAGKYGNGLKFVPSLTDEITIPTSVGAGLGNITVEGWVYFNTFGDYVTFDTSFGRWNSNSLGNIGVWQISTTGVSCGANSGVAMPALKTWFHFAITYNGSGCTFYINGVAAATATGASGVTNTYTCTSAIGMQDNDCSSSHQRKWDGNLDEFKIYNYVLAPSQILEDMNGGHPVGGSPVASQVIYWKLDEGYGTGANSVHNSGNGGSTYNGNNTGAAWLTNTTCKVNGCLNFDTTTDNVSAGDVAFVDSLTGFATSFWINPQTLAVNQSIISKNNTSQKSFAIVTDAVTSSEIRVHIAATLAEADNTTYCTTSGLGLTTSTWQHITVVYDGTQATAANRVKVYKNGIPITCTMTGTFPTSMTSGSTSNLKLGDDDSATYSSLLMYLDEVKIYNAALTQNQVNIEANFGGGINFSTGQNEAALLNDGAGVAPVGYWNLEENTGTTAFNEGSQNGTGNMAINSCSGGAGVATGWVSGKYGTGLKFSGVSAVGSVGRGISTFQSWMDPASFSVSFWMNTPSVSQNKMLVDRYASNVTNIAWAVLQNNADLQIYVSPDGTSANRQTFTGTSAPLVANTWQHIEVVFTNGTGFSVYVNGILKETFSYVSAIFANTMPLILASDNGCNQLFNGSLDEVKFYNYVRTQAQVVYDFNRGKPVGWWKFNECQGTTANDASGNANNGAITITATGGNTNGVGTCTTASSAWGTGATGKFNSSLNFDGNGDYVNMPNSPNQNITGRLTVSAWVYPTSFQGSSPFINGIVDKGQNIAAPPYILRLGDAAISAGTPQFVIDDTIATDYKIDAGTTVSLNSWSMVTGTYDGTNLKIYINGILKNTNNIGSIAMSTTTNPLRIGWNWDGRYFAGQIDDVRIYNYALSATQIQELYNQGGGVRFGPVTGTPAP